MVLHQLQHARALEAFQRFRMGWREAELRDLQCLTEVPLHRTGERFQILLAGCDPDERLRQFGRRRKCQLWYVMSIPSARAASAILGA